MDLMPVVGGIGVGVVVGWLLPVVRRRRWQSALASGAFVAVVIEVLFLLAGLPSSLGGATGIAVGAFLHAAFLEHLARNTITT